MKKILVILGVILASAIVAPSAQAQKPIVITENQALGDSSVFNLRGSQYNFEAWDSVYVEAIDRNQLLVSIRISDH